MEDLSDTSCLLKKIEKQELETREFGFYWDDFHQLIKQIQSECTEIQEAWDEKDALHLQEEIGDLIHAAVSLAVFCQFDPHETLSKSFKKFQQRYEAVVQFTHDDGLESLKNQSFEKLMSYWKRAKVFTGEKS